MATDREKPLVAVAGRPTVDRVLDALAAAERVDRVHAVVSPNAPTTREHVTSRAATTDDLRVIRAPGDGYVADLTAALDRVDRPVASVAADVPLLAGSLVDRLLAAAHGSTTVVVPARLKRGLGVSVDERPYGASGDGGEPEPDARSPSHDDHRSDTRSPSHDDHRSDTRSPSHDDHRSDARSLSDDGGSGTDRQTHTTEKIHDAWVPSGVNVVGRDDDEPLRSWDARLAVNLNYWSDVQVAERLAGGTDDGSREGDG